MKNSDSHANDLDVVLAQAEQSSAERETSVNPVIRATEAVSPDNEQAEDSVEALRQRLDAKEEQLRALQRELRQRDQRIAQLEHLYAENDNAVQSERMAAMGLVLKSTSDSAIHRISRITTTIGRANGNDIVLNTNSVSRYHARIVVASDATFLIDLHSTNGCNVNGERISRRMLIDGDRVTIGDIEFKFGVGVPLSEVESQSMSETQVLLDDSVIFTPAPASKTNATQERVSQDTEKAKQ